MRGRILFGRLLLLVVRARPMLARGAKSLRASSLRPAGLRLASGVPARTPEQTEHLEKLAEEHNGFLFGEVVRAARASPDMP